MDLPGTSTITKTIVGRRTIRNKYVGFKSFICTLLVFLAVLIMISLLMFAIKYYKDTSSNEEHTLGTENIFGEDTGVNLDDKDILKNPSGNISSKLKPILHIFVTSDIFETATEASEDVNTEDDIFEIQSQENEDITFSPNNSNTIYKVIPYNNTITVSVKIPTTEILDPETISEILEPITSTDILESTTTTEILDPVTSIENLEPVTSTDILESTTTTEILEPVTSTDIIESTITTEILEPVTSTDILESTITTEIFESVTNTDILESTTTTEILEPPTTTELYTPPFILNISEIFSTRAISAITPNSTTSTQLSNPFVPSVVNVSSGRLLQSSISKIISPQPTVSTGYFGINLKPVGKVVNKQLSMVPGLTIRTVNDPPACLEPICKRAASYMLSIMNHDDQLNYCDDYYYAICQNPQQDKDQIFFKNNFRGIQKIINNAASANSIRYFNSFFKQCIDYGDSINRMNRISGMKGTGASDAIDAVVISILTQSMPFFDVGVNILNNKFIFEMTLPGSSFIKTNIKGWSLREQFKESCIAEIANGVTQNVVELNSLSNKIDDCIKDLTTRYLNNFLMELEPISKLPGMSFLGGLLTKVQNINLNPFRGPKINLPFGMGGKSGGSSTPTNTGDSKADLADILQQVQDSWIIYRKAKNPSLKLKLVTLKALTKRYNLDIDWTFVFQQLTQSVVDDDTQIYFSEHLDQVFQVMVNKKNNLKEMLDLWYNVQFYKNTVIEKQVGNRAYYCMDLVSQLMPEVSSFLISDLNKHRYQVYDVVEGELRDLKQRFEKSLYLANFSSESIKVMKNRIDSISVARPILSGPPSGLLNVGFFDYWSISGTYQEQLIELIKHYKKMMFDQVTNDVTGERLLKYFVYAFDTEPKAYPPYREIVYQPGFTDEMSTNLPNYVKLAKQGLLLAQQFSKHFIRNDFIPRLDQRDAIMYDDLLKNFDTKHLVDRSKYNIENIDCEVEDVSGKNLQYESVVGDNLAFRLVSDIYLEDPVKIPLPFADYPQNETFITIALQDFCKTNNIADFIGDFYNLNLPAPIKVRNMALNSELFAQTYACPPRIRKQFPFIENY